MFKFGRANYWAISLLWRLAFKSATTRSRFFWLSSETNSSAEVVTQQYRIPPWFFCWKGNLSLFLFPSLEPITQIRMALMKRYWRIARSWKAYIWPDSLLLIGWLFMTIYANHCHWLNICEISESREKKWLILSWWIWYQLLDRVRRWSAWWFAGTKGVAKIFSTFIPLYLSV